MASLMIQNGGYTGIGEAIPGDHRCLQMDIDFQTPNEANDGEAGGAVAQISTLSPNLRSLYLLWDEYENGIGGRKAARLFSREERGKVKDKFHRRKVVWDCVATLVRAGLTAQVAIDRIHHIYGENTTVTNIINRMKQDRQAGIVNPMLQV